VRAGQLLDVVRGRSGKEPRRFLEEKLPKATLVADPFHVVKLANSKLDECRRRVQDETLGHRGRKLDPLYRCRKLLTMADERLEQDGRTKLLGLLRAGDPKGEVTAAWHASHVSNGPTEAANNLIKRVKRAAFGFTSFRNYRVRSLLYAGRPNWELLATITPR
jgi:transposase